ncbi:hypothetical protein NCCP2222_33560 [Sporosarcina sp. NCCP-2222]|uniref:O-antigen ligase family protein n=1 Tax=Sporosarcina sp. NCCP-2222 TaxID=2935073 RepID=UPI002081E927|nr:O-antigen ligase family protein [Sporosarcina sp. NCCP-2222]GKV57409.1 hypothetical protein NCCP2222_33560 [Sporosarcina sp. NCCP-2222]
MSYYYKIEKETIFEDEEDKLSQTKTDRWIFGLLLIAIGLVPLLVGGHVKDVIGPNITNIELLSSGLKGDLFTYYKMTVLIVITVIAVLLLLSKIMFMNGVLRKTKLNIFLGIFLAAIILSTLLSPSISIALWGQFDRSDGAVSYICYLALFFVAMNIQYPKRAIHYVMYILYPFVFINFILITMNFYGYDAMKYTPIQKFMTLFLPEGASLGESSTLVGTLNQWNYMSGMFAIITVMYLAWAILDKNKIRSITNLFVAVASLAIMLMSISTSGFLTLVAFTPFLLIIAFKSESIKKGFLILIVFYILSVPVFHVLATKDYRVWDESIGFIVKENPYFKKTPVALGTSYDIDILFGHKAYAADSTFELPNLPERGVAAGSGRAYIWEKTINLTMNRPLIGYGLDTLKYHFPHYNIDARSGMLDENTIIDKPHSMYVGIFYGTGIFGFIGFAGVLLLTVIFAVKIIFTRKHILLSVLAIGWLAFLFQALFNDSLPGTAGPMWAIAGIMMGLLLANNDIKEKNDGRDN